VIARIACADKRVKVFWVIPRGDDIKTPIGAFKINDHDFTLTNGNIPTFNYKWDVAEPIDLYTNKVGYMTPQEYDVAISAGEARKVFDALPKKGDGTVTLTIILLGVLIAGLIAVAYLGYKEIETLRAIIEEIRTKLNLISGI